MTSRAEQLARLTAVVGILVFLAVVVAAFVVLWGRCTPESVDSVEARLGEHELLTTLLPDDAMKLEGPYCRAATAVDNNFCTPHLRDAHAPRTSPAVLPGDLQRTRLEPPGG